MAVDDSVRRHFVDELRALGGLAGLPDTERVLQAFATVPRELFVGPGPWTVVTPLHGMTSARTPDADPRHLYHAVLVALDEEAGINIGAPTLWARLLARFAVPQGGRLLQVGAGSGYYTAILAELVGSDGSVVAYETEDELIEMAANGLRDRPNVELRHDNAAGLAPGDPFDAIVAFAGVTRPPRVWCDALASNGRMLLPLTGGQGWGAMGLFERRGDGFSIATLGPVGFYPCHGARDPVSEHALDTVLADRSRTEGFTFVGRWVGERFEYEA